MNKGHCLHGRLGPVGDECVHPVGAARSCLAPTIPACSVGAF